MQQEQAKPKRGRPVGSNSFVKVKMKDLLSLFGEESVIPVSKIFLRENSIDIQPLNVKVSLAEAKEEVAPEAKIEFSMTSFED